MSKRRHTIEVGCVFDDRLPCQLSMHYSIEHSIDFRVVRVTPYQVRGTQGTVEHQPGRGNPPRKRETFPCGHDKFL